METQVSPRLFQLVVLKEAPSTFQAKQWLRFVGLEQEVKEPDFQVKAAAAAVVGEEEEYMLFGARRRTRGSQMYQGIGGIPGRAGPLPVM